MRIIFMGTPDFAVPSLEQLVRQQEDIVAVYTQPDKPGGRGRSLQPSAVKQAALDLNLPVLQPARLKSAEAAEQLRALHPDVIVVAAYGKILPPSLLTIPRYGCINIHASLLPRYRGASPVMAAILAGEEVTGISIMLMDEGMDTGPVLAQERIPISPQDTTGSLLARLSLLGANLLTEVLPCWIKGEITPRTQNDEEATYCGTVSKEDAWIDWRRSAIDIWRQVRAYQPWPGSSTRWQGRRLEIIEAAPLHRGGNKDPGHVVLVTPPKEGAVFGVSTGDGILGVLKVKLEGKRALSADEFIRGQRHFIGSLLSSE